MKIAIVGLSNSGKTTIFNALTGMRTETSAYPSMSGETNVGVVKVPDPRLDRLAEIFRPRKFTPSTVQYLDCFGLTKGDPSQNRKVFDLVKDSDALLHVVRAFEDEAVPHPLGTVDPLKDVSAFETELVFGDLELVEKRIEGIELLRKKGKNPGDEEYKALIRCREWLGEGRALRDFALSADEHRALRHLRFMSVKPQVVVLDVGEGSLRDGASKEGALRLADYYGEGSSVRVIALCGKVEMEIAEFAPSEAAEFLSGFGLEEPARDLVIRACYESVGLISFFTVGSDEVRAWAISRHSSALEAAGKIHTDIQKGFIRAEVVSFEDFIAMGNMSEARDRGLLRLEGKTYEVKDGDIINFRFNV